MSRLRWLPVFLVSAGWLAAAVPASARIILITLPVRERVEIQLDNPNATLVEEERIVPLVKGENQVDFSWANTQINPDTIVFRVVGPGGRQEAGRESALGQLSAQRGGAGVERRRERFRLGPRADQLLAGEPHARASIIGPWRRTTSNRWRSRNTCGCRTSPTRSSAARAYGPASASEFLKPIGINETKEMLVEKFEHVPIKKTYTCNPAGVRLSRPAAEQAPRADALRAEKRQSQSPGRRAAAIRQGADLHRGGRRGQKNSRPRSWARTGGSSRPSTTK